MPFMPRFIYEMLPVIYFLIAYKGLSSDTGTFGTVCSLALMASSSTILYQRARNRGWFEK